MQDINNYVEFCKVHNLKPSHADSLLLFFNMTKF